MSARRQRHQTQRAPARVETPDSAHPEDRSAATIEQISVQRIQHFQGPLPPAEELARYETALAGCAERIVSMAEEQAAHRRAIEARMIAEKLAAEHRGQVFAFILVLVSMLVGGALIAFDKDIGGLTAILGALASVVAIFVYGRRKDAEERREKRSDFASPQLRLPYDEATSEPNRSSHPNEGGTRG